MSLACPLECVQLVCDKEDFVEANGAWVLSIVGMAIACFGTLFTYFLRSRCKTIKCACLECDRNVVELDARETTVRAEAGVGV